MLGCLLGLEDYFNCKLIFIHIDLAVVWKGKDVIMPFFLFTKVRLGRQKISRSRCMMKSVAR